MAGYTETWIVLVNGVHERTVTCSPSCEQSQIADMLMKMPEVVEGQHPGDLAVQFGSDTESAIAFGGEGHVVDGESEVVSAFIYRLAV